MVPIFEFVRKQREVFGLTQKELADRAGFSISVVKRFEANRPYNPRISQVAKLAKALQVETDYLVESCEWLE